MHTHVNVERFESLILDGIFSVEYLIDVAVSFVPLRTQANIYDSELKFKFSIYLKREQL